jgi:hypothetical protein
MIMQQRKGLETWMSDDDNEKNVVNLADARRRQRTARVAPKAGKSKSSKGPAGLTGKVWIYAQALVFLALVSYFMRLCKGP